MEPVTVKSTIWINAPRERVWRAITESEQIRQWWGNDYWEITALEVGAVVKFGDPDDLMHATVAVVDPLREFSSLCNGRHSRNTTRSRCTRPFAWRKRTAARA